MATFSLSFRGHPLDVFRLQQGVSYIGRDEDCELHIDSLAIAPRHAQLVYNEAGVTLIGLDPEYPLIVNGEEVHETELQSGDLIHIGKHSLTFTNEGINAPANDEYTDMFNPFRKVMLTGYMQVLGGSNIGRIIPLTRSLTRLGQDGEAAALIAHRNDGFFISYLDGKQPPRVNGEEVRDKTQKLTSGNVIEIGHTRLQFYAESA